MIICARRAARKSPSHCTDAASRSRRAKAPGSLIKPYAQRAWGMPGARCTRSLVCENVFYLAHEFSQRVHRINPAFPHAMVLRLMARSPRSVGLSCLRRLANFGVVARSGSATPPRDLTPTAEASGPHAFAVRRRAVRLRALPSLTENRPATNVARGHRRVHRSPPHVRDDGQRPSFGTGWQIT